MASPKESLEIDCEFCKKTFLQSTILRHIGQSIDCKAHYRQRFIEMKKEKARDKVNRNRNKMTLKEQKKSLKKRRKSYAKNEQLKEQNRETYQKNKEKIKVNNEKESKDFLLFKKQQNEEEIDKLPVRRKICLSYPSHPII